MTDNRNPSPPASGEVGQRLEERTDAVYARNVAKRLRISAGAPKHTMYDGILMHEASTLIEQLTAEKSASEEREGRMRAAAQALSDKLEVVHADPQYQGVWSLSMLHGATYTGPSYASELIELRAALTPEGQKVETK